MNVMALTVLAIFVLGSAAAEAGGVSQAVAQSAAKRAAASAATKRVASSQAIRQALRQDARAHAMTPARPLARSRTVHRYTTRERARWERTHGIPPGRHMTAQGTPGRPLGAVRAQQRYGLPHKPEVREIIKLPKGNPVRHNKVHGGTRGQGELTVPKRLPPAAVQKVVPLR